MEKNRPAARNAAVSALQEMPKIMGNTDPLHVAELLPGVQTSSEYDAGLHILGCDNAHNEVSLDGTLLLGGEVEDFLLQNSLLFPRDGMISQFTVTGSEAPTCITQGEGGNAKNLYQTVIGANAVGTVDWIVDTQGPLFRGVTAKAVTT